jgi:hypothetical protein
MSGAQKTLRMKNNLRRAIKKTVRRERFDAVSQRRFDACARRYDADAERWGHVAAFASLPMSGVSRHNGRR